MIYNCFIKEGGDDLGAKYTEAQNKATQRYMKNAYDDVKTRVPKGTKDIWKAEAEKRDKSLNQFVIDCVEKEINSEN